MGCHMRFHWVPSASRKVLTWWGSSSPSLPRFSPSSLGFLYNNHGGTCRTTEEHKWKYWTGSGADLENLQTETFVLKMQNRHRLQCKSWELRFREWWHTNPRRRLDLKGERTTDHRYWLVQRCGLIYTWLHCNATFRPLVLRLSTLHLHVTFISFGLSLEIISCWRSYRSNILRKVRKHYWANIEVRYSAS